ncbi:hypothetical protein BG003_003296 [Podila horticola]|nr:hypothetical protein BG003_003296 [Podila horticola]
MSSPANIIQLLPHIAEAIAETLTFADLVHCVRVNHEWYDAFTKFLYEDLITFRSKQTRPHGDWDGCEYFVDPSSRTSFARHAHHIRGLTCQQSQLSSVLLETRSFENLIEINLIMDDGPFSEHDTGLDTLSELIARCPRLQAVSVENLDFPSADLLQRLADFTVMLKQYPLITCIHFSGPNDHQQRQESGKVVTQILETLLAKVPKEAVRDIRTLVMRRPELLTRSNRGPSRGQVWSSREQPAKFHVPDTNLWREIEYTPVGGVSSTGRRGGRWENEVWAKVPLVDGVIAVIHTAHELHLEFDYYYIGERRCLEILSQYGQHCHKFMVGIMHLYQRGFWYLFPNFPELASFDLNYIQNYIHPDRVLQPTTRLSSYRLLRPTSHRRFDLALAQHYCTLVEVDLDVMDISMEQAWRLLASAPNLQSVRIPVVLIDGSEPEELPGWASRVLDKLSVGLCLEGHERDLERGTSAPQPKTKPEFADNSAKAAQWLRPLFMAQINAQNTLRELELGFNHRRRLRRSPFLDLSLDPIVGLPQLSNLERLERFVVSGLVHRMGNEEMAWISKTWPRLISLEVPVIHHWKGINEAVSTCRMFFSGEVPELQQWCPGRLKVVMPIDCYCCGRCESIYCECRNISQDQWAGNVQWDKSYSNDDDYVLQE